MTMIYLVSSIIMPGAEDFKTLEEARKCAKKEAVKLARKKKEYPKDQWVTIDKFSRATGNSRPVESWMYHPVTKTFSKERYVGSRWV